MKRHIAIVCSLILVLVTGVPAGAAPDNPNVVPGRFLVRTSQTMQRGDQPAAPAGWRVVLGDPNADPTVEADRLSRELGTMVVPDSVLDLAEDPFFTEQWSLDNTGQTGGTPGADVGAVRAWEIGDGAGATIAVIDSGAELSHPDLAGSLWSNPGETPGNGVDDDGNGFVDDGVGWDFVDSDGQPDDVNGHGTRVTGILGARRDDTGIAGLASGSQVMILRACSPGCPVSSVAAAVDYAVDAGADVINMSLGGGAIGIEPLHDAIIRAGAADVLVVAAAGNSGADLETSPFFPASFTDANIVSVSATDADDSQAAFSNYGNEEVDLAAPGVAILSTTLRGDWALDSGTSFAAPLAAAVAGMIRALRPDLTAEETRSILIETVDPIAALASQTVSGGRLDAGRALEAASAVRAVASVTPMFTTAPAVLVFDATESTGPITTFTWFINGEQADGIRVEFPVEVRSVVSGVVEVVGSTEEVDTAEVTAYVGEAFDDIADSVFFADVVWLSASGGTDGCSSTSYCTDAPITRGEAAALVRRMAEIPPVDPSVPSPFLDDDESIFEPDLTALALTGVIQGCNPPARTLACPEDLLRRDEMAAILTRAFALDRAPQNPFVDDDGSIFADDIAALWAAGISIGCNPPTNNRYCPDQPVTRGELAAFLHRSAS